MIRSRRHEIHAHPVAIFFVLACLLAWVPFLIYLGAKRGVLPPGFQLFGLAAKFGPSFAGIICASWFLGLAVVLVLMAAGLVLRYGWKRLGPGVPMDSGRVG